MVDEIRVNTTRHPALNKAFHPMEVSRPEWPYRVGDVTRGGKKKLSADVLTDRPL